VDATLLARIQFAVTVSFHFIFPQLTIGMSWLLFWMMARWVRTGDARYRTMARFWTHVFALGFAVGVATGVVMEFQFGTNWAAYARYVGDIFGAPLAAEGVFAFFLESTFLGMLLFGWNKLSPKTHLFSSAMVALGSTLSAFWIIVANSWQQTPVGYHLVNGRAEMTSFAEVVFNPSTIIRLLHTVDGALIAGSLFVLGLSAWFLLRKRHVAFAVDSMQFALILGLVATGVQLFIGHGHAVQVYKTQPAKLAAFEGHFNTEANADLLVFGVPDVAAEKTYFRIPLPGMLSYGVSGDFSTPIKGLKDFPRDEWPPVLLTFFPFHTMVALWVIMLLVTIWGVILLWRGTLPDNPLYLRLALWAIPAPILASTLGWMTAEVGRQPWIVYGLLRTKDAVSTTVGAGEIAFSLVFLSLVYAALFAVWIFLLRRRLALGPEEAETTGKGATA
jgi:cytochrome d ubiquinol oxidase subunit I